MIYLLIALINLIYGALLFLSLSSDTPGYLVVFIIASVLAILGFSGLVLWVRMLIISNKSGSANSDLIKGWFQITKSFDIVLIIGVIIRTLVFQPFIVDGDSMLPNFHNQEAILVDKISYHFRMPERGEVIIFKAPPQPDEDYIKRIIGIPGDTVLIEDGKTFVNGKQVSEAIVNDKNQTYINGDRAQTYQITLGQDQYFVLGDNRLHSSDSREWNVLPKLNIIGKAYIIVYPFNLVGIVHTPPILL